MNLHSQASQTKALNVTLGLHDQQSVTKIVKPPTITSEFQFYIQFNLPGQI